MRTFFSNFLLKTKSLRKTVLINYSMPQYEQHFKNYLKLNKPECQNIYQLIRMMIEITNTLRNDFVVCSKYKMY